MLSYTTQARRHSFGRREDGLMYTTLLGVPFTEDVEWVCVVRYVRTDDDWISERLTPDGWVRYEGFEVLEPTLKFDGLTMAKRRAHDGTIIEHIVAGTDWIADQLPAEFIDELAHIEPT